MTTPDELLRNNRQWATRLRAADPAYFRKLAAQQTPSYLWIGCSDSRVPSTQLVDLAPGEMFVHRNVANVVVHTDLNCLAVMQFAIEILRVKHIIVCGHYQCGGVRAVFEDQQLGLIDNWLRHVQNVMHKHTALLTRIENKTARFDALCELNVLEQVRNVCQTTIVQHAWRHGQDLTVHGWIYGVHDGEIRELGVNVANHDAIVAAETCVTRHVMNARAAE